MMTSKYFMSFAQLDRPILNFTKMYFVILMLQFVFLWFYILMKRTLQINIQRWQFLFKNILDVFNFLDSSYMHFSQFLREIEYQCCCKLKKQAASQFLFITKFYEPSYFILASIHSFTGSYFYNCKLKQLVIEVRTCKLSISL